MVSWLPASLAAFLVGGCVAIWLAGCLAAVWGADSNAQVQKYEVVFNNLKASGNELEGIGLISGVQSRSRILQKCRGSGDILDPPP